MTIAKKLYLLIIAVILGLCALTALSIYQSHRVSEAASYSTQNTVPSILALDQAIESVYAIRLNVARYFIEPSAREKIFPVLEALHEKTQAAFLKYEKDCISDAKDEKLLEQDRAAFAAYEKARHQTLALVGNGQPSELSRAREELLVPAGNRLMKALTEHKQYNEQLGRQEMENAASILQSSIVITASVSLLIGAMVAGASLLLVRLIVSSLRHATHVADAISRYDLTSKIDHAERDEIGHLMQALKRMNDSLCKIIGSVGDSTGAIQVAAGEIASGNLDLSSRTEAQAGSLEETATAMGQLTATVRQNADNAHQANELAASASAIASQAGDVVNEVVVTMDAIHASSLKIVGIISVIDGIAFQTNILALNAAVEAARAGEQGRGFAVVASEVRSLAQRSAAAAREIKELIDDSVHKVGAGSHLVAEAGNSMEKVVHSVRRVTDIVGEISSASSEQSAGIEQIHQAIGAMDDATQQNAALVEQAAAASQSLQEQAAHLVEAVGVFRLHRQAQWIAEGGQIQAPREAPAIAQSEALALPA
ncbi:methyl-accepting chemotaxis protein [uncultured Herbaspirillum sp.]|uniref:methyl-accepting chemotaxis protein n=1 Tax=uncultured Herbaspirillum sp. TaxID=160236 RepID=UPI0025911724|nr:methyl-accepting chemotaxis protein [uncultured Herbaspirillum sp.]